MSHAKLAIESVSLRQRNTQNREQAYEVQMNERIISYNRQT